MFARALPRDRYRAGVAAALATLALFAVLVPGSAAFAAPGGPSLADDAAYDRARDAARRDGTARVIVGLPATFRPEGSLDARGVRDQRAAIARERSALRADLRASGAEEVHAYETLPYVVLVVPERAVDALARSQHVAGLTLDQAVAPGLAESSPLVQADALWTAGFDGAGRTVAVLDTGVQTDHPFVTGRTVSEACYSSTGGDAARSSLCPSGQPSQTGTGAGADCATSIAGCGHGTHVAGIAAGRGDSASGVARGASLMAVQVFHRLDGNGCTPSPSPCVRAWFSDVTAGLERVYALRDTHAFAAVNLSLGGGRYTASCDAAFGYLKTAIDNLRSVGVATVIASGNNAFVDGVAAPGCISTAVTVGNTTKADTVFDHASYGSNGHPTMVDLLAPGTSITSSVPGSSYASKTGTSMAAPHVAGAFAVLAHRFPAASVDAIELALESTGRGIVDHRTGAGYTLPRIRLAYASAALGSGPLNDAFAAAEVLAAPPVTVQAPTANATDEVGEPSSCARSGGTVGATVWYRFELAVDQNVTVSTAGSAFDTVVAASTGTALVDLQQVACNDDATADVRHSTITFPATAGTTYWLQVGGWGGASGDLVLDVEGQDVATVPAAPTGVSATAGHGAATVSWTAPADDGGSDITAYRVTASPSGATVTVRATARSATVDGLDTTTSSTFAVRATNAVGAGAWSAPSNAIIPDTQLPDTSITSGPTGTTTSTSASFSFTSSEDRSSFQCRLDGGSWRSCTSPDERSGLTLGAHSFDVRAIDLAGNVDGSPARRTWTVEAAAAPAPEPSLSATEEPQPEPSPTEEPEPDSSETQEPQPEPSPTEEPEPDSSETQEPQPEPSEPVAQPLDAELALPTDPAGNSDLAIAISELSWPAGADGFAQAQPAEVLLASERVFADALASGALQRTRPLLLNDPEVLEDAVAAELQRLAPDRVRILGGTAAVSAAVEAALVERGYEVVRTAGASRLETAIAVSALADDQQRGVLARAFPAADATDPTQAFADSLALGGWAAAAGRPLVLSQTDVLSTPVRDHLSAHRLEHLAVIGGTAAIAEATMADATGLVGSAERIMGATRFDTAVAIAHARGAGPATPADTVIVIEGQAENAWAAGFTVAALSARDGAPVLLVNGDTVPDATAAFLAEAVTPGAGVVCVASPAACAAVQATVAHEG